jgi:hypothetical protein
MFPIEAKLYIIFIVNIWHGKRAGHVLAYIEIIERQGMENGFTGI